MKKLNYIFLNLSTRNKLVSAFSLIIIIIAYIEYNEYHSLARLSQIHEWVVKANSTQSDIKDAKLYILQDTKVMQDMLYATKNDELEKLIYQHQLVANNFLDQMQSLIQKSKNQTETNRYNKQDFVLLNSQNQSTIGEIIDYFQHFIKPSYEKLKQLKQESFNLQNELSSINSTELVTDSINEVRKSLFLREQTRADKIRKGLADHFKHIDEYSSKIASKLTTDLEVSVQDRINEIQAKSKEEHENVLFKSILLIVIGGSIGMIVVLFISHIIAKQLASIQTVLKDMSYGKLTQYTPIDTADEIGAISHHLSRLILGLKSTSDFAVSIGMADFENNFTPMSSEDELGNSLIEMRKSLQVAAEDENRRKLEDARRTWTTEGLAQFNDILRQNNDDLRSLMSVVLSNLVKYIEANQAGLFVLDDSNPENKTLNLLTAYAYNRKKFIQKTIREGEGLLGATAVEKHTVYLTEIPQDYLEIQSALGGANPGSLLIVPLKLEETIYGILEISSFRKYDKFEINFVERVAENIASTLSTIKINSKTAELLEQSRVQAQEMHEKENLLRDEINSFKKEINRSEDRENSLQRNINDLNKQKQESEIREEKRLEFIHKQEDEYKTKEEKQKNEIKRLSDIINLNKTGLILLNSSGLIEQINHAAESILAYESAEVLGTSLQNMIEKSFFQRLEKAIVRKDHNVLKELIGHEERVTVFKKQGVNEEIKIVLHPLSVAGEIYYALQIDQILEQKAREVKQGKILENLMAKEFEYQSIIETYVELLESNNITIPEKEADNSLVKWGKDLELGLEVIDEQHKTWVNIINTFYRAFKEGEANNKLAEIIKELIDYTDYHFSFEERYFKELKFHKTQEHITSHRKFVNRIIHLQSEFKAGKLDAAYDLMNFLKPWVKEHILVDDRQYIKLFQEHHVRYSLF